ncbi:MAG: hypothetical protein LQ341_005254, partial [Variospora aurantia]
MSCLQLGDAQHHRIEVGMLDKKGFFTELYELDKPDDSDEDVRGLLSTIQASRPSKQHAQPSQASNINHRRVIHTSCPIQPFGRTVSASSAIDRLPKASLFGPLHEDKPLPSGIVAIPPPHKITIETSCVRPSADAERRNKEKTKMSSNSSKKRKRSQSLEVLSEAQQIFRDFIPNDDVAPARKRRIRKTMERGAAWIKQWDDRITHIIVDKSLSYSDILKFLKMSSIPSNMAVVNELYPSECIQYQMLVNPSQRLYQVQGFKEKLKPEKGRSFETPSIESRPLKSRKSVAKPSQTPTRTEASDQNEVDRPCAVGATTCPVPEAPVSPYPRLDNRLPDALDKAIEETLAVKDLPLGDDDDDHSLHSRATESSGSNESEEEAEVIKNKALLPQKSWQSKFSCMDKNTATEKGVNPNARTVEILQQMSDYYDRTRDHWRSLAYRKCVSALRKQPNKITTKAEALSIPGIGDRLATKIEEIAFTDRLRRLENTSLDDRDTALQLFLKIYGVGPSQASQWIDQGHRTLADLLSSAPLTKNQRVGIAHIDDFAARIPRHEVERHANLVRSAFHQVDPTIEVTVGGSYRRGAPDSGDVDFIVTKPDAPIETLRALVLDTVIPRLFAANYLKASLAAGTSHSGISSSSSAGGSKWHGCACLPGSGAVWRRVDFLLVPQAELGAALIYFTGNDIFNRSLRLLASKKGYRLNQRGLWRDVLRGKGRERVTQGSLVEGRSERRIFEILE